MKSSTKSQRVPIPVQDHVIHGDLVVPTSARALVIFALAIGSDRHSPLNKYVAKVLNDGSIATLLVDLLTSEEDRADLVSSHLRFDISLLADRLVASADWVRQHRYLSGIRLGYFGAGTGTAAALVAGARRPDLVSAIVSLRGRPDLASRHLGKAVAPTLLIVGEFDYEVLLLNREARQKMEGRAKLEIVPRTNHLFEEKGALEQVAFLARAWFEDKLMIGPCRAA